MNPPNRPEEVLASTLEEFKVSNELESQKQLLMKSQVLAFFLESQDFQVMFIKLWSVALKL